MSLAPGSRLGPYELVALAGAGGMGEVYRARDTRLDRTVAVKVLPPDATGDPEWRARFDREARTISQLQHPHICTLFDIGRQDDSDFLVLEYLEGETLAARLQRLPGPMPLGEVLRIGTQLASALEHAHRQGLVHRDIKPGNVMLTKQGAKLLDFGLAKSASVARPADSVSVFATQASAPLTARGTLLGTFQYMAPEQVEGREADVRSDVFAFGCVLYEMIAGQAAFAGKSPASVMAAILEREPRPLSDLAPLAPPALDAIVRRALAKDSEERWQSIADLGFALKTIATAGPATTSVPAAHESVATPPRRPFPAALAAGAGVALLLALGAGYVLGGRPSPAADAGAAGHATFVSLELPEGVEPWAEGVNVPMIAVSHDGRRLAIVGSSIDGTRSIYWRDLGQPSFVRLPGTEEPFGGLTWSPDGTELAFQARGKLLRLSLDSLQVREIAASPAGQAVSATWSRDGVLAFSAGGDARPILAVPVAGGAITEYTRLDKEADHSSPCFVNGGPALVFNAVSLNRSVLEARTFAVDGPGAQSQPLDVPLGVFRPCYDAGYLVSTQAAGRVIAVPMDPTTLRATGPPFDVQSAIESDGVRSAVGGGVLAVYSRGITDARLMWVDRRGQRTPVIDESISYRAVGWAPASGTAVFDRFEQGITGDQDLWIVPKGAAKAVRLTTGGGDQRGPVWHPDGDRVYYYTPRGIASQRVRGIEPEQLVVAGAPLYPKAVSADGRTLLYEGRGKARDLFAVDADGTGEPQPVIASDADESGGQFSPDGRWIAYTSNEAGRYEIYVQPYPPTGGKRQISSEGGVLPRWRGDGRELYYVTPDGRMMAVPMALGPDQLQPGAPVALFETGLANPSGQPFTPRYDVTPDGQRFLLVVPVVARRPTMQLILNWPALAPR